jgi:RNA polymerase sigma-70 factor (ECF subfamily)
MAVEGDASARLRASVGDPVGAPIGAGVPEASLALSESAYANGYSGDPVVAETDGRVWSVRPLTRPVDDHDLVIGLRNADPSALEVLYDRYAPAIHGLARAILRDDRLAEEATHDVFLGLWQDPRAYEPSRGPFAGWLLRVARNRAIDLLRRRREQPFAATVVAETGQTLDPTTWLVDPDPDPADQAASRLVGQDVRRALSRLSADHRRLLEMAYFGGLTQREIAAAVNRPLGTVKTQIRTAMHRMADLLQDSAPTNTTWGPQTERPETFDAAGDGGADRP